MTVQRIDLDQEPIWTIQFDETVTQYRAFCLFRDMLGAKTLAKVAEVLAKERESTTGAPKSERLTPKQAPGTIKLWSSRNRWVERAEAYELYLEEERRRERDTEVTRMESQMKTNARFALALVSRRLFGYEDKDDPSKSVEALKPGELTAAEIIQLAKVFGDEWRLLLGRPTSLSKSIVAIDKKDYVAAIQGVTDILLRYIPQEHRSRAAEEADAFLGGAR